MAKYDDLTYDDDADIWVGPTGRLGVTGFLYNVGEVNNNFAVSSGFVDWDEMWKLLNEVHTLPFSGKMKDLSIEQLLWDDVSTPITIH